MKMETLQGEKRLTSFFRTGGRKGMNLNESTDRNDSIKDLYNIFWVGIANYNFPVIKNHINNFCGEWTAYNDKFKKKFIKTFRPFVDSDEQCNLIWLKFKGNNGEVFGEWFFRKGACQLIDEETYTTIDPDNEDFKDASATSSEDEYPIGIQIKNWTNDITFDIFGKAGAQIVQTGSQMKREYHNFSYEDYYKEGAVRQIIFSTTERVFNKAMDVNNWLHDEHIEFIGPKTIDKYIQKFTKESFKREIEKHIISKL